MKNFQQKIPIFLLSTKHIYPLTHAHTDTLHLTYKTRLYFRRTTTNISKRSSAKEYRTKGPRQISHREDQVTPIMFL